MFKTRDRGGRYPGRSTGICFPKPDPDVVVPLRSMGQISRCSHISNAAALVNPNDVGSGYSTWRPCHAGAHGIAAAAQWSPEEASQPWVRARAALPDFRGEAPWARSSGCSPWSRPDLPCGDAAFIFTSRPSRMSNIQALEGYNSNCWEEALPLPGR